MMNTVKVNFTTPQRTLLLLFRKETSFQGLYINAMENQTSITLPEEACEIQSFIESQRPDNTTRKTTYDINVIKRYFKSINERREIENIPARELNIQLAKFFPQKRCVILSNDSESE